jgi:hypothetical protein
MLEIILSSVRKKLLHILGLFFVACTAWWAYSPLQLPQFSVFDIDVEEVKVETPTATTTTISSDDDAVRAYMRMAQELAAIYQYTNNGSYSGMCEPSETLNSLSQNIFIYIKHVGATELFCTNSNDIFMIEAQLPQSKKFVCIDSKNQYIESNDSNEGQQECVSI